MPPVADSTWICPTPEDRTRVLDMERRLEPVRLLSAGLIVGCMTAGIPWLGIWPLPLCGIALVGIVGINRRLPHARHPEHWVAASWLLTVALISTACVKSGGVHSPGLAMFAVPAVTLPARFRSTVVALGTALILLMLVAVSFLPDPSAALHDPLPIFFGIAVVGSVIGLTLALMRSDLDHRSEAFIDPLTGMLNRHALDRRVAELAALARVDHQPVGLIVADIDHFKRVNDEHGHETGDSVLTEVAYRIRRELRAYDLSYRMGGEEFLVVLPGADAGKAQAVAESLRLSVANDPIASIDISISLGVSASSGDEFDYAQIFSRADKALYEAKRRGRNRVCVASSAGTMQELSEIEGLGLEHPAMAHVSAGSHL